MKNLLALAVACVSVCAIDTNVITNPITGTNAPFLLDTTWQPQGNPLKGLFQCDGTNICEFELATNVVTQWMPVEQEEGQPFSRIKQVGALITNQVLTVIAYGKTKEVLLKQLGREEWPSQKRTVMVPNQHAQPRK